MNFGEYLRVKRIERNLTLRSFSSLIKKVPSTVSGIENGDKVAPSDAVFVRCCI